MRASSAETLSGAGIESEPVAESGVAELRIVFASGGEAEDFDVVAGRKVVGLAVLDAQASGGILDVKKVGHLAIGHGARDADRMAGGAARGELKKAADGASVGRGGEGVAGRGFLDHDVFRVRREAGEC